VTRLPATRSTRIGTYALDAGPTTASFAQFESAREKENQRRLGQALADEHDGETGLVSAAESVEETATAITDQLARAETIFKAAAEDRVLEPSVLTTEIDGLLDLFGRLDTEGRFEEELRVARVLNALLILALRWIDLVRTLRTLLRSARVAGNQSAQAWALHELGSLHLCAGEPKVAEEHFRDALRLQEDVGESSTRCATRHNLDCARRDLPVRAGPPRLLRLAGLVAVVAIIAGGATGLAHAIRGHHHPTPAPATARLTVKLVGRGTVTGGGIDCTGQGAAPCRKKVVAGSTVLLTAAPGAGLVVTDWKGTSCGSGNNTCSVSVNGGTTVTVVLGPPPPANVTLTVVVQGSGKVTDGRLIDCRTRCTQQFPAGEQVNLTAIPGTDWKIESWSDPACPGPTTKCALILNGDTTLTVTFASVLG
jgi:hypothetical protein